MRRKKEKDGEGSVGRREECLLLFLRYISSIQSFSYSSIDKYFLSAFLLLSIHMIIGYPPPLTGTQNLANTGNGFIEALCGT